MKNVLAISIFVLLFIASSSAVLGTGEIISYYSFDTTGGNEYKDSTGRYDLTNSGGTTAAGLVGTAYYANSAGDFLNITTKPAAIGGLSKLSICGWTKYVSGLGPFIYGVGKASSFNKIEFYLYDQDGVWQDSGIGFVDTGSATTIGYFNNGFYSETIHSNNFGYSCMVYNGSASTNANRLKLYHNNTLRSPLTFSGTVPATTPTTFSSGFIGKEPNVAINNNIAYYDEILVFNGSLTPSQISCLYNSGTGRNYDGTQTCLGISATPTNFSITATNAWDNTAINDFNATVDSIDYQSVNGTLTTRILSNRTTRFNITVEKYGFFDNITLNRSALSNLAVVLRQSIITIEVRDSATNDIITGASLNFSGKTIGTTFFPGPGLKDVRVSKAGYINNNTQLYVASLDNLTHVVELTETGFTSIQSLVTNLLGETDDFTSDYPLIANCSYTHSGNESAIFEYSWQNGSATINTFLEPTKTFDSAYYHTCAIRANDSSLWCWGSDSYGKLGTGGIARSVPVKVSGNHRFKEVSLEFDHTCALRSNDSRAMCWGWDGSSASAYNVPTNVPGNYQFSSISAGYHSTCALRSNDSRVMCWGMGADGALGNGDATERTTPTLINSTAAFNSVSTNYYHSCGVRSNDSRIMCWGRGLIGQLGQGINRSSANPILINSTKAFISVSAGYQYTAALSMDGKVYVWGYCVDGRCVDGTTNYMNVNPHLAAFPDTYSMVTNGDTQVCAIRANDSRLFCGGWNWKGEVGDGTTTQRLSAVPTTNTNAFSALWSGHTTNCALRANDSKMFCWGRNDDSGQIGDGTTTNRPNLTPVAGPLFAMRNLYTDQPRELSTLPKQYLTTPGQDWNFTCTATDGTGDESAVETYSFNLYNEITCTEDWVAMYSALTVCRSNSTYLRLKTYLDLEDCGTTLLLPGDNNTVVSASCTYTPGNNGTVYSPEYDVGDVAPVLIDGTIKTLVSVKNFVVIIAIVIVAVLLGIAIRAIVKGKTKR